MRFGYGVIHESSFLFGGEEATALHEPEMFGGHVAGDLAGIGQFPDGVFSLQEHLHHAESMGMRQSAKAFGGLAEAVEIREFDFCFGLHVTPLQINISEHIDMSITENEGFLNSLSRKGMRIVREG